ncbi:MAG: DUF922 domain-containing Zn-dependent protease [Bacteroidetes bacterium]|nr:DUF922 domain-containing Zn-dependent protease [Bacteroidota bacterium]
MKTILTIFASLSLLILYSFLPPSQEKNDDTIIWSKDRPLTWDDFKMKAPQSSQGAAWIYYNLSLNLQSEGNTVNINTATFMIPKKSWVKNGSKSEELLKHEQGHFDIAEIHARKLRKSIQEGTFTHKNIQEKINKIYSQTFSKLEAQQKLYDKETDHHRNKEKQIEWNERIARELKELATYSNPIIEITLK